MARKSNKTDHVLSLLSNGGKDKTTESKSTVPKPPVEPDIDKGESTVSIVQSSPEKEGLADTIKKSLEDELEKMLPDDVSSSREPAEESEVEKLDQILKTEHADEADDKKDLNIHIEPDSVTSRTTASEEAVQSKASVAEEAVQSKALVSEEETVHSQAPMPEEGAQSQTPGSEETVPSQALASEENVHSQAPIAEETIQSQASVSEKTVHSQAPASEQVVQAPAEAVQAPASTPGSGEAIQSQPPILEEAPVQDAAADTEEEDDSDTEFAYINVMERLVQEKVVGYMEQFRNCTCSRCVADTTALALTQLPPKYVVISKAAVSPLMNFYTKKYAGQITVEITKACIRVGETPHHSRD